MISVLSTLIFSSGCATTDADRLAAATAGQADAALAPVAARKAGEVPPLPADCRVRQRAGVTDGDRLDVAAVRLRAALDAANDRVTRCAAWYDDIRASRASVGPK
jgi:hypothetical protein